MFQKQDNNYHNDRKELETDQFTLLMDYDNRQNTLRQDNENTISD